MLSNSQFILLCAVPLSELSGALFFSPVAQMMPHDLDPENHIYRWFSLGFFGF